MLPKLGSGSREIPVKSKSLMETYAQKRDNLVRVFAARLRSMSEAEDLIQDLFFKVERLENQEVGENPSALLFQMANHLMLDRLRSQKRAVARDAVWLQSYSTSPQGEILATEPSAEAALAARQQLAALIQRLDDLPEKVAQAFRLHKLEGRSQADTAEVMGISQSTVEKHISVALKRLMRARN